MKRSGPIKRYTPVRKRKPRTGDVTVGKTGRIRLRGEALEALRRDCFTRDGWRCTQIDPEGRIVPCACGRTVSWVTGHMAHIVSRGAGGSDVIDNVHTMTQECHGKSHNCAGKPLPAKVKE
jgi:5-methylcytosine-specific restriction endonuclease McrA